MAIETDFFDRLQIATERFLTSRRRRRRLKREIQKSKNPVIDWAESFLWAACVVLLVNQYLFQAYQIPSGSMMGTMLIGDRIFVNKLVFGPELLPGLWKLPSPYIPGRGRIVIFENPAYLPRGPVFDIAQRVIYMLTLSMVDIDKDDEGETRAHFLIKRSVGMPGDRIRSERGDLSIKFAGRSEWRTEEEAAKESGTPFPVRRLVAAADYPALRAAGERDGYGDLGTEVPASVEAAAAGAASLRYPDYLEYERARLALLRGANPHEARYAAMHSKYRLGWYVPEGRIFPLGDNRDNSRDARYFGPVRARKVLGEAVLIYWPIGRFGRIR